MVCVLCVQMMASAADGGSRLPPGCLCLNPDSTSDADAIRNSPPLNKDSCKSHLDPNSDHLSWEATKEGEIRVKRFDESRLMNILKEFASAFKSSLLKKSNNNNKDNNPFFNSLTSPSYCCFTGQTWNWAYQRAIEMKSDTDHVLRAVEVEKDIVKTGGKNTNNSTTATSSSSGTSASYWNDYNMWQGRVLNSKAMNAETNHGKPSAWDLIHLAVATGGLGSAQIPRDFVQDLLTESSFTSKKDNNSNNSDNNNSKVPENSTPLSATIPMNFFQLVDLSTRAWKVERSRFEQEVNETPVDDNNNDNNNNNPKRQSLFPKDRLLRAAQAKILAAKCLASRKLDYPNVVENYCEPARRVDPQAAREAAFVMLSKGYEANIEQRKKKLAAASAPSNSNNNSNAPPVEDPALSVKWYMFYDEVVAPIVMFPCSTCPSPCMSAPQSRLPWGGSVSVGELRQKLDALAPGFVDVLQKHNSPMECESVKAQSPGGATPVLPSAL